MFGQVIAPPCGLIGPLLQFNTPHCKALMPFSVHPFRRFPVPYAVTYHASQFQGQGTVWNLSLSGWRLSGDLPQRPGEVCSLTVSLPSHQRIFVNEAVVGWGRESEYGTEIRGPDPLAMARLENCVNRLWKKALRKSRERPSS